MPPRFNSLLYFDAPPCGEYNVVLKGYSPFLNADRGEMDAGRIEESAWS